MAVTRYLIATKVGNALNLNMYECYGLSTDIKPTNCAAGSTFEELDQSTLYKFDGTKWWPQKSGDYFVP